MDVAVCNSVGKGDAEFADGLQARASDIRLVTGRVAPPAASEQVHSEIEIAVPGERAVAEITYRTADGRVWRQTMDERQISIVPAGQPHQLSWRRGTDLTVARIAPEFLKGIARERGMRTVEVVGQYGVFDPVIWHLGRELGAELRRHGRLDSTYLQSVASVFSRHLLATYSMESLPLKSGGLPRFKLRLAVEYMHENLAGAISFRDVARHVQMSPYHFARMFRESTGQSPHRYIVRCRIERAKALLAEARLPISDVAAEVGYKSQSHFTTRFARLAGVTPGAFRAGR